MSVKLYKNNMTGEIVAAAFNESYQKYYRLNKHCEVYSSDKYHFEYTYSPIPEASERGSDEWAIMMVKKGHKIRREAWPEGEYLYMKGIQLHRWWTGEPRDTDDIMKLHYNDWQLYEEPLTIIECLPHEFVGGQRVLVRGKDEDSREWIRTIFLCYEHAREHSFGVTSTNVNFCKIHYPYCIPFVGNEHLENTVTDGEHGAVPKGYIPPHIPKLGDDDYWQAGDEVVCLSNNLKDIIKEVSEQAIHLHTLSDITLNGCYPLMNEKMSMRVLYHKGSYVRSDGTVHEHIPTRPHRIEG